MSSEKSPILSIDFGTSNSLVGAVVNSKRHEALPLDPDSKDPTLMRTLLYFPHADLCYYGQKAINQFIEQEMEGRLFRSFKARLPQKSYLGTVMDNRIITLEFMVGAFLLELKKRSEAILKTKVTKAVIGRPARYSLDEVADQFALHRMEKAAEIAGFDEVRFVPEPLAAAFDYRRKIKSEKLVLIGDFGGGTSDFTIIRLRPESFSKEDVLSIEGCPLAGDALDSLFMRNRLNQNFGATTQYRIPMSQNLLVMPTSITDKLNYPSHIAHLKDKQTFEFIKEVQKCAIGTKDKAQVERLFILMEDQQIFPFFEKIEHTKRELSGNETSKFSFDYPGIETEDLFTRQEFQKWAVETQSKIMQALDRCLEAAKVQPEQIDLVALTGGTSQVPFIKDEFVRRFGAEKLQSQSHFHSVLSGLTESALLWDQGIDWQ